MRSNDTTNAPISAEALVKLIEDLADSTFRVLYESSRELTEDLQAYPAPRYTAALQHLESSVREQLTSITTPVVGMGFVGAREQQIPAELEMAWWKQQGSEVLAKKHILNPASDSYYDYNTSEWFGTTRASKQPFISAPYVDSWGTDELTITAAVPILVRGNFVGLVAADLDPGKYLAPISHAIVRSSNMTVVDAEGRIILSSLPHLTTGMHLQRYLDRTSTRLKTQDQCRLTKWQVVEFH